MVVGEFTQETDLLVIGGGPGGYSAAFRAAELGVPTVIVDPRPSLGGVCLHEGCVPSKTFLHIADIINHSRDAAEFGVAFASTHIDVVAVRAWKDKAVRKLASGLEALCKKHGVERIEGHAHFEDSRNVGIVGGPVPRIRFKRALIATGSQPIAHPLMAFDDLRVLSPQAALRMEDIPSTLLVIGSNYMAAELASMYDALGSQVTLLYQNAQLLPEIDDDLVRPLLKRLANSIYSVLANTIIKNVQVNGSQLHVTYANGETSTTTTFDRAIVALGQHPLTAELQLEKVQVSCHQDGFIITDHQMRTNNQRIFAVGDVTGEPMLADKALHQGRVAAEVIAGQDSVFDVRTIPMAVFTNPSIAACGLSENDAKIQNIKHKVAKIPWGASGRAVGMGRSEGMTKIIYESDTQRVLGVGMVGLHACEMISEAALAVEMGAVLTDLAATIHPHPTLSELLSDAARSAAIPH